MYKLIALDLDGTLLNSEKMITTKTAQALIELKDNGIKIVLASARPYNRMKDYLSQLELLTNEQYTISFNGAFVTNNAETEILISKHFSLQQITELLKLGSKFKTTIFMYSKSTIYSNEDHVVYRTHFPEVDFQVTDLNKLNFHELEIFKAVFIDSPEHISDFKSKLTPELYNKFEITSSELTNIEFACKGIKKSKALEVIGQKLNIELSEMAAFGDQQNDLEMLQTVGFGVAMGNAPSHVKENANYVTTSNNEDGVAAALALIYKQGE